MTAVAIPILTARAAERLVTAAWPRKGPKAYEQLRKKSGTVKPGLSLVA